MFTANHHHPFWVCVTRDIVIAGWTSRDHWCTTLFTKSFFNSIEIDVVRFIVSVQAHSHFVLTHKFTSFRLDYPPGEVTTQSKNGGESA